MPGRAIHPKFVLLLGCVALGTAVTGPARAAGTGRAIPAGVRIVDDLQRISVNRISMPVTNSGSFTWDRLTGFAGLEYPKGSGKTAMFAAGLWVGALVDGLPRVTESGTFDEFRPGAAVGGAPDDPVKPEYRVHRLSRHYPSTAERDAALADYVAGAVAHGAPGVPVLPDGSLDVAGDEMLWCVYNDLDPANHVGGAGGTLPLGLEVQQTTFAFDRPGALGSTVFARYRLINRGTHLLTALHVGFWMDPDIGVATDDLAGCDPARGLGFGYNAVASDAMYGAAPPAVGLDLLQGVVDRVTGQPRGLTAFADHGDTGAPASAAESLHLLEGLTALGDPLVNPVTALPTTFQHSGDPVAHTGWLDAAADDKRLLLASGPSTLAPGEQQDVIVALIVAQGTDRLNSVSLLKSLDTEVQAQFDSGTLARLAVSPRVPASIALEPVFPNPSRGELHVACVLPDERPATIELLDVSGRRVSSDVLAGAGRHVARLAGNRALPPGLYLVRLARAGESVARRVLVVR